MKSNTVAGIEADEERAPDGWKKEPLLSACGDCGEWFKVPQPALRRVDIACPNCSVWNRRRDLYRRSRSPEQIHHRSVAELLFSYKGRINRKTFWLTWGIPGSILAMSPLLLTFVPGLNEMPMLYVGLAVLTLVALCAIGLPVIAKRLHDRGASDEWLGLVLLPLVAPFFPIAGLLFLIFVIALGVGPGQRHVNRYGPPPKRIRYVRRRRTDGSPSEAHTLRKGSVSNGLLILLCVLQVATVCALVVISLKLQSTPTTGELRQRLSTGDYDQAEGPFADVPVVALQDQSVRIDGTVSLNEPVSVRVANEVEISEPVEVRGEVDIKDTLPVRVRIEREWFFRHFLCWADNQK